jgi:hypothetical protein
MGRYSPLLKCPDGKYFTFHASCLAIAGSVCLGHLGSVCRDRAWDLVVSPKSQILKIIFFAKNTVYYSSAS